MKQNKIQYKLSKKPIKSSGTINPPALEQDSVQNIEQNKILTVVVALWVFMNFRDAKLAEIFRWWRDIRISEIFSQWIDGELLNVSTIHANDFEIIDRLFRGSSWFRFDDRRSFLTPIPENLFGCVQSKNRLEAKHKNFTTKYSKNTFGYNEISNTISNEISNI